MARREAFFKVIAGPRSFERIKISPGYANNMEGNLPSMVILKDRYGNHWQVNVINDKDEFFFSRGWKKFTEENHLEIGDFLVFYDEEPNLFNVVILGRDSCVKKGVGENKNSRRQGDTLEDNQCESMEEGEVELYSHEHDDNNISIVEIDDDEDEEEEEVQNPNSTASGKHQITEGEIQCEPMEEDEVELYSHEHDDNNMSIVEIDDDEDEEEEVQNPNSTASGKHQITEAEPGHTSASKSQHEKQMANVDLPNPKGAASGEVHLGRAGNWRSRQRSEAAKAFQERNLSPPKNPYFVAKIRKGRKQMLIPMYLILEHDLQLPKEMILRDSQGREWKSELSIWDDGRTWYTGGWADLCKENSFEKEDLLACEFSTEGGKQELYLKVQILRA